LRRRQLASGLHRRQAELVVRCLREAHRAVHLGRGKLRAALHKAIEIVESAAGLFGRRRLALDRELISLGPDVHAELLLDAGEIFIERPVKPARRLVVVKGQYDVRHVGCPGGALFEIRSGGQTCAPFRLFVISAGPLAGSLRRLFGPACVMRTRTMSPTVPALSSATTGCSQGERPTSWPGWRPGFSRSTSIVRPTRLCVKAWLCSVSSACRRCRRSSLTASGT